MKALAMQSDYQHLREYVLKEVNENQWTYEKKYYYLLSFKLDDPVVSILKADSILNQVPLSESVWRNKIATLKLSFQRQKGDYVTVIKEGTALLAVVDDMATKFDLAHILSISYRKMSQLDSAMIWATSLEEIAHSLDDDQRLHRAAQNMANIYDVLGEFEKALSIEQSLLSIAAKLENKDLLIIDLCNLGSTFKSLSQLDSASHYYQQALETAVKSKNSKRLPLIYYNLANMDHSADQYQEALEKLNKGIQLAQETRQPSIEARAHYLSALCFLGLNEKENLYKEIEMGLSVSKSHTLVEDELYLLKLKADMLESDELFSEANQVIKSVNQLEDSLFTLRQMQTVEELRTKYETEKKEQELATAKQQNEIVLLKNQQQQLFFLVIVVLILSGTLIIYLVLRAKNFKAIQQRLIVEQRLLRTQMNPHFLFNALASINAFIFKGDKYEASEYLNTFSQLTRNVLMQSTKEWITLKEELNTVSQYLEIQKLRFSKLLFQITSNDELNEMLVPPVLLQPFVENSIIHGFKGSSGGEILIQVTMVDEQLLIEINDSGIGLSDEIKSSSEAMKITRNRLELLYPKTFKNDVLFIFNRMDKNENIQGVTVRLVLPVKEAL